MKMLSLFSGIGSFDLAAREVGIETVAFAEKEESRRAELRRHFGDIKIFNDVRDITKRTFRERVDIIAGGSPCQDFSVAGERRGLAGSKSALWFEFQRIIWECKPQLVIIENVPGLLSCNKGLDFRIVLAGVIGAVPSQPKNGWCNAGIAKGRQYNAAWRVLDAQFFGVPQRRRRLFVIASLGSECCAEILFNGESGDGSFTKNEGSVAATLTAGSSRNSRPPGRRREDDFNLIVDEKGVRRNTPLERERLQGFPDNWTQGSDNMRNNKTGDAIAVPVAKWIMQRIVKFA